MNRAIAIALLGAAGLGACTTNTPAPMPTPQVVRVEVPGPTVEVEVPGDTIYKTPVACVAALNLNGLIWQALGDETVTRRAFKGLVNEYIEARDVCLSLADDPTVASSL